MAAAVKTDETTEPHLERVKPPRTEKQEKVVDAINKEATVKTSGELDVNAVLRHLREEHDDENWTSKSYIWQVVGEFFIVVKTSADLSKTEGREIYRQGYRDGTADATND